MARLARLLPLVSVASLSAQADPRATDLDRRMMSELTGRHETVHARLHYDPNSVSETQRDAAAADLEAGFASLEGILGMRYQDKILVFLYRDHADLEKRTGSGAVAFSTGTVSLHQPHDFRGVHELTHLFAMQFPRPDDSYTDLFVVEGLATILAESDQNVPIHAWAAVYLQAGRLPDLMELRRTFPEGAGRGVHPYHVAGSFVGFLVDRFGMAKVKSWYADASEARHWFGKSFRTLEREWRAWLATTEVEDRHRAHVLKRLGLSGSPVPEALRTAEGVDLLAARKLDDFAADDASKWTYTGDGLRGSHDGPWTHLHTERAFGPRVAVRARLRLVRGDAVKLRCNRADGQTNEAIFATWATYLSAGGGFVSNDQVKIPTGAWSEVLLVHDRGTCSLYLNGTLVLEAGDAPGQKAGSVGIAVEKGTIDVGSLEAIEWK